MKKIILVLFVSLLAVSVYSQSCEDKLIPSTAIVKMNDNPWIQTGDAIWICEDRDVDVQGDLCEIYLETNSTVTLTGDNNTVYAKSGTTVIVAGDGNDVEMDSTGVTLTDNGTNTTIFVCEPFVNGAISFDYTDVDTTNGCITLAPSGIRHEAIVNNISVFPNPVSTVLNVALPGKGGNATYNVYSISGKVVLSGLLKNGTTQIDMNGLNKGLYFIEVQSANGKISKRISVE